MARGSWIAMLGYFAFVFVTLLGVEDADFFVPSRQTQLPLVNVSIPTASFFWFAPALGAALYVYLHIVLLKLWDAIADLERPRVDGHPVGDLINPWLANDWALTVKGGDFAPARPLRRLGNLATLALVWGAMPFVLCFAWLRSMPAHDEKLTLWVGACLLLTIYVGRTGRGAALAWLAIPRRSYCVSISDGLSSAVWVVIVLILSWIRTEAEPLGDWRHLSLTSLYDARFVTLPSGWRDREDAAVIYRLGWCQREGIPAEVCGTSSDDPAPHVKRARVEWCERFDLDPAACAREFAALDQRFRIDWQAERQSALAELPKVDLSQTDLRRALAPNISLVGADLTEARLDGAYLSGAWLEGANLHGARMTEASLFRARLEGTDLAWSRLEGAQLMSALLSGVDLSGADMRSVDLTGARIRSAALIGADLRDAIWIGANIDAALALGADLRGARGLSQDQLDQMIGDGETLLPTLDPRTGEAFHVWTCWDAPQRDLEEMVSLTLAAKLLGEDRRASVRGGLVCGPGNPRRKTGTPWPVEAPRPEGHPLGP